MNKGTALKWIERLESGKYINGGGAQLRYTTPYSDEYCIFGVLADFLDPNGWKHREDWHDYSFHGELCFIKDEEMWKKCKFKNRYDSEPILELIELSYNDYPDFRKSIDFIKNNYEGL